MKPGQYITMRTKVADNSENGEMVIRGVASDASVTDSHGTRIRLADKALEGFRQNAVCLYGHNVDEPIGTIREIGYNGNKLEVEAVILPGTKTPNGTDIQSLVRAGALNAFSIRFDDFAQTRKGDYIQIDANALDEISLVALPSNKASLITMRSQGVNIHGADELIAEQVVRGIDARVSTTRASGPLSFRDLASRLAEEVCESNDMVGYDDRCYLTSVYDDFCVFVNYNASGYYKQGYAVDADGNVELTGDRVEVLPAWTEVNVTASGALEAERGAPYSVTTTRTLGEVSVTTTTRVQTFEELRSLTPEAVAEVAETPLEPTERALPSPEAVLAAIRAAF